MGQWQWQGNRGEGVSLILLNFGVSWKMNNLRVFWNPFTRAGFGVFIDKPFVAVVDDNFAGCFDSEAEAQSSLSNTPGGIVIESRYLLI
jgi:hypothetical protein